MEPAYASKPPSPGEDLWPRTLASARRQRQGPRLGRGGRLEQGESAAWAALGTVDQIDDARVTGRLNSTLTRGSPFGWVLKEGFESGFPAIRCLVHDHLLNECL